MANVQQKKPCSEEQDLIRQAGGTQRVMDQLFRLRVRSEQYGPLKD